MSHFGLLWPSNVVARTNNKPLPIVAARTGVHYSLSTTVLTRMLIRVRVGVVKTGQCFLWETTLLKYFQRRRKRKLYRQWVARSSLPPDAIPREKVAEDMVPQIDKQQSRLHTLYILLGIFLVILCVGLILLIVHSCWLLHLNLLSTPLSLPKS